MSDMDLELMFPSKYLAAADLDGKAVTVKIKAVSQDELAFAGGKKEKRIVVRFEKTDKLWLMNKTNAFSLGVLLWQSDLGQFRGKRVTLISDEDVIKGELTTCVRVSDSPDATPKGRAAFMQCWNAGDRKGNKMIERLKRVMGQVKKDARGAAAPPPPPPPAAETPAPVSPHPEDAPPPPETGGGDFKY